MKALLFLALISPLAAQAAVKPGDSALFCRQSNELTFVELTERFNAYLAQPSLRIYFDDSVVFEKPYTVSAPTITIHRYNETTTAFYICATVTKQ